MRPAVERRGKQINKTVLYSVAVGNIAPWKKTSREAVKYITILKGMKAVHPNYPNGTLILFNSLNNAKIGRNKMKLQGIKCGDNICKWAVSEDWQSMEFKGEVK